MHMTERARTMWRTCLAAAFRTSLACTIVGAATLHGPAWLLRYVTFPAFSYVTVILIATDATLGDTLRGCWLALYATCQSVGPALISLRLIGPAHLSAGTTSVAVALAGLVVVLPSDSTHLVAKRIALGQIVLTYVIAYIKGPETDPIMHPLRVAASTAVGVLACVIALLLPYPRLASREVKQSCKEIGQGISERLKLYINAFCADNATSATASISQARLLARSSSKLYQTIKRYQPSMKWERLPFKLWRSQEFHENTKDKLQNMETVLRGMEMALTNTICFPATLLTGEVKDGLTKIQERINLAVKRINNCLQPSVNPESVPDKASGCPQTLQEISGNHQDLPFYFFFFCLKLLENISMEKPENIKDKKHEVYSKEENCWFSVNWRIVLDSKRIIPAIKLSLSLGLAVLFGSMYSKPNGYWSGLPVAISFAAAREATFKVANVKAQGTVIGTVYGVMGCFVFERFLPIRFLSLLPWFVFSSFLSKSRMYGQAGAISAAIGAVLILGRKNFGPPSDFAIARIVETSIGLSCSIMVELFLQPTRGSTLAKIELSRSFHALHESARLLGEKVSRTEVIQSQKNLKSNLNELKNYIQEAQAEPNFWFLPFNGSCYDKLFDSLSKMADLLQFSAHALGFLGEKEINKGRYKEGLIEIDEDLKNLTDSISSIAKSFEEITLLKSLNALENAIAKNDVDWDIEMGKSKNPSFSRVGESESEPEKVLESYLRHCRGFSDGIFRREEEEVAEIDESNVVLSLNALGFCMEGMVKEMKEIEERIKEFVQWENPTSKVNLHEISCKIRSLYK